MLLYPPIRRKTSQHVYDFSIANMPDHRNLYHWKSQAFYENFMGIGLTNRLRTGKGKKMP
ncbi:MAG TPA: hypothetical protein DHH50_11665 [Lachnospiraceae bacterium]|nr:hypothetical protein [Lachnospiraceae bacterium]